MVMASDSLVIELFRHLAFPKFCEQDDDLLFAFLLFNLYVMNDPLKYLFVVEGSFTGTDIFRSSLVVQL